MIVLDLRFLGTVDGVGKTNCLSLISILSQIPALLGVLILSRIPINSRISFWYLSRSRKYSVFPT